MGDVIIELEDVSKWYGRVCAIEMLSLRLERGQRMALLGRTGAGKSTALNLMVGAQQPSAGRVTILGNDPSREFDQLTGRISIAFQQARLLPWRTALDNAALGLQILGHSRLERRKVAAQWLDRVHLGDAMNRYPAELSGGMQQRVSLARAFAIEPEVIFLDEAFSALDEATAGTLRNDFVEVADSTGTTAVIVTHNIEEAFELADRIVVLASPGRVAGTYEGGRTSDRWRGDLTRLREEVRAIMRGSVEASQPDNGISA